MTDASRQVAPVAVPMGLDSPIAEVRASLVPTSRLIGLGEPRCAYVQIYRVFERLCRSEKIGKLCGAVHRHLVVGIGQRAEEGPQTGNRIVLRNQRLNDA